MSFNTHWANLIKTPRKNVGDVILRFTPDVTMSRAPKCDLENTGDLWSYFWSRKTYRIIPNRVTIVFVCEFEC